MEIFLDKKAVKQIRVSAQDAVDEGDSDTLREDIIEAFNDEQIEEIERRVDAVDFNDFISEILDEWSGDEVDELFELLEGHLAETPDNGGTLYNLACALARAGRPEDALARLTEAVALENRFLEFAQNDDDLASIRDDPSFPRA
jgi:hypothetical protein